MFWLKILDFCKIISSKTGQQEKLFRLKIFYCCKLISSKTGQQEKFFVENFLLLQNHFLVNRSARKKNLGGNFYCSKSFPQNCLNEKFILRKFIWSQNVFRNFFVVKLYIRKQFERKYFLVIFSLNYFFVAKSFPRK